MKDIYCKIADWIVSQNIDKAVNSTDIKEIADYVFNVQLKSTGVLKVKECLREKGVTVKDAKFKDSKLEKIAPEILLDLNDWFNDKLYIEKKYNVKISNITSNQGLTITGSKENLEKLSKDFGIKHQIADAKIKDKKYIVYLNGEPYYTAKSYDEAMRIESQLYSASDTEDDFQSYYGSYPDVEIRELRDSKFRDSKVDLLLSELKKNNLGNNVSERMLRNDVESYLNGRYDFGDFLYEIVNNTVEEDGLDKDYDTIERKLKAILKKLNLKDSVKDVKDSKLTRKQKIWYGEELENLIYPQYLRRNYQKRKTRRRKK